MNAVKIAREQNVTLPARRRRWFVLDGTKFIAATAHYDENVDPVGNSRNLRRHVKSAIPMGSTC
ncbi:hypothetical protein DMH17_06110 [Raoultella planticola]|nr:hypothetical protein [Raoultella planticola]